MEFHQHGNSYEMLAKMPTKNSVAEVAGLFGLVSDPTRLKVLWLLCHMEMCVNNVGAALNMSAPAVSHHLRLLKQEGMIEARRIGKEIHYRLSDKPAAKLLHKSIDDMFEMCCHND